MTPLQSRLLDKIDAVPREAWNALVPPGAPPVLKWEWLHALEASGSATKHQGWEAQHLTLWRGKELVGAAPAWRKHHSMGEYVYDFSWAEAARSMGVRYYPKFLVGVPLSPLTAPRFLTAPGEDGPALRRQLLDLALEQAREQDCSSLHIIFPPEDEATELESWGLHRRSGMQYHWKNPGFATYEDYLSRFDSKRRNQIKRERGAAATQGVQLRTLRGQELTPEHARLAFRFYESTVQKNGWGQVQLNRSFFERAVAAMPSDIELVVAERAGKVVAGAFNLATATRLYGRYWGCFEELPFLHFHVCLYHSIDDCIRLGRECFEPGAGGEHKISRGFEPTVIHSVHRIFDKRLDTAVRDFVRRERREIERVASESEQIAGLKPWPLPGAKAQPG